ncbi:MAG: hypothetical protein CO148_05310 [Nitrospirae bacterium CG_4_9_14_3_um_filter_41_27]|nr:MAG: hypothetical protein COV68_07540 [Nitrospirae bacterium CG11_big_fil_rev_8_21_14_0_20_41_14]PIV44808.1 MAG: hypothetical protein COS27_00390 [Nitrospirae bacterium CG02_land_8_20_14_3_00_41_53]PJA79946.1 MAG: hypothetical protein CO148_05310 [Nitrospirae bacterium CG_4_9_14_3_um_filter_41_27]
MFEENEELNRVCMNCCSYYPADNSLSDEGICLNDEAFEPYVDEIIENNNYECCRELINKLKFDGNKEACKDFEPAQIMEIDEGIAQSIRELKDNNDLNAESLKELLLIEALKKIDWKNHPVESYIELLQSGNLEDIRSGVNSLGGLIARGNDNAFIALLDYFKKLPPAQNLEEVYLKIDVLEKLNYRNRKEEIFDCLIDKLYKTPSNNTTKSLILKIFRIMESIPLAVKREQLGKMLKDKRFTYKLKKKMKGMLYTKCYEE